MSPQNPFQNVKAGVDSAVAKAEVVAADVAKAKAEVVAADAKLTTFIKDHAGKIAVGALVLVAWLVYKIVL